MARYPPPDRQSATPGLGVDASPISLTGAATFNRPGGLFIESDSFRMFVSLGIVIAPQFDAVNFVGRHVPTQRFVALAIKPSAVPQCVWVPFGGFSDFWQHAREDSKAEVRLVSKSLGSPPSAKVSGRSVHDRLYGDDARFLRRSRTSGQENI
jgi:hypothetical protein